MPGANKASTDLVNEWAEKEKVEVTIDYIPSQGNKNLLTIAAEAQAKSGHDIFAMPTWWAHANAEQLEAVNDIMGPIIAENGEVNGTAKYLGTAGGKWLGVPACVGSQIKGPCSRIDLMKKHAGIDVQEMYPAGSPPKADNWTLDTFLKAAEACHKGGVPFGIGLGETTDNVDTAGAIFLSFGAAARRRQGQSHRQDRRGAPGAGILQEADRVPAAGRRGLGRRLQQQMAGFRQGRADHESAERLGGRQARRAAGCRAVLDPRLPGRTEGPFRALPALFLEHLELLQEQGSGQEPADRICRSRLRSRRW